MAFGDSDLATFTADFGVAVVFNGATVMGIFDKPQKLSLADDGYGGINTTAPVVRIPRNAFATMPKTTATITVDGTNYTVDSIDSDSDGGFVWLTLMAVA
jgi:hypothetical protein